MRVINLDAIGIKLIANNKKQLYLSKKDVADLLNKNYTIDDNVLCINNKLLKMTDNDVAEFDTILEYIAANFGNI